MLLEVEKQHMQEDLEESRREVQKNMREVQVLQARLKDAITWDEHCNIAGNLRRYRYNVLFCQVFLSLKDELISIQNGSAPELGHSSFLFCEVRTRKSRTVYISDTHSHLLYVRKGCTVFIFSHILIQ